jgi:predicted nucleic acid-binding protein
MESWLQAAPQEARYASVISLAEIRFGIRRLAAGRRQLDLAQWYDTVLRPTLSDRVLPFDEDCALIWADLRASYPNCALVDAQLAATAFAHDLTLVTRNVRDFAFEGLKLFNPWSK